MEMMKHVLFCVLIAVALALKDFFIDMIVKCAAMTGVSVVCSGSNYYSLIAGIALFYILISVVLYFRNQSMRKSVS